MKLTQDMSVEVEVMPNGARIMKTYKVPSMALNRIMIFVSTVALIAVLAVI